MEGCESENSKALREIWVMCDSPVADELMERGAGGRQGSDTRFERGKDTIFPTAGSQNHAETAAEPFHIVSSTKVLKSKYADF